MLDDDHYIECGYNGKKCRVEFNFSDPNISDFKMAFESILTFLTFHPDTIKDLFCDDDMG